MNKSLMKKGGRHYDFYTERWANKYAGNHVEWRVGVENYEYKNGFRRANCLFN